MLEIHSVNCNICQRKVWRRKITLKREDIKKIDYTKLRLTNDYEYNFEEEKQTDKKPDKKDLSENPTKDDVKELNELINKEEMDINRKLFQTFFGF